MQNEDEVNLYNSFMTEDNSEPRTRSKTTSPSSEVTCLDARTTNANQWMLSTIDEYTTKDETTDKSC